MDTDQSLTIASSHLIPIFDSIIEGIQHDLNVVITREQIFKWCHDKLKKSDDEDECSSEEDVTECNDEDECSCEKDNSGYNDEDECIPKKKEPLTMVRFGGQDSWFFLNKASGLVVTLHNKEWIAFSGLKTDGTLGDLQQHHIDLAIEHGIKIDHDFMSKQ